MKRSTVTFLLMLLTSAGAFAQMRQMVWPLPNAWDVMTMFNGGRSYGTKLLLDFHSTPPSLLELPHDTLYGPNEAISSICNRWGQLQFYSDNHRVWSGSHELVENIDNLHGYIPDDRSVFSTVANATMILPFPGDSLDRYFSLWTMNYDGGGYVPLILKHSIIDRYGGTTGAGILLDQKHLESPLGNTTIQEGLTAVKHANGRDWWIICRKGSINSDTIISLLFTPMGIESVNYFAAPISNLWLVNLKASNDGSLLAEALISDNIVNLYSFNRCNGHIEYKSSFESPNGSWLYGLAFSPKDELLYVGSGSAPARLYQLSILGDTIHNAIQLYSQGGNRSFGQFSLAPDGKIYCIHIRAFDFSLADSDPFLQHLGVIQYPDETGIACEYNTEGFYLNGSYIYGIGLPNHPNYDLGPLRGSICDSLPDPVIASVPVQAVPSDFSVTLYPNPTSQEFTVVSSNADMVELVIYNALGKEIWRTKNVLQRMSVSVAEWPLGIYTVIASTTNGVIDKKQLVIQR